MLEASGALGGNKGKKLKRKKKNWLIIIIIISKYVSLISIYNP